MDPYIYSMLILCVIVVTKLVLIVCLYTFRMRRLHQMREAYARRATSSTCPYSQRSAIVHHEEIPQGAHVVSPGGFAPTFSTMSPPPYSEAIEDKPPRYEQVQPPAYEPTNNMNALCDQQATVNTALVCNDSMNAVHGAAVQNEPSENTTCDH